MGRPATPSLLNRDSGAGVTADEKRRHGAVAAAAAAAAAGVRRGTRASVGRILGIMEVVLVVRVPRQSMFHFMEREKHHTQTHNISRLALRFSVSSCQTDEGQTQ